MSASKKSVSPEKPVSKSIEPISLSAMLSKEADFRKFKMWLIGDTPLIVQAWSEKAKQEMLGKQVKATKTGKEARDPKADFVSSLYPMHSGVPTDDVIAMGKNGFGFPVTGIKKCILSSAHKDKGIAKTAVMSALYLDAEMVRVMPALAGAICDLPLVRIYSNPPEMREDMVRIGAGLNKVANLAYRAQFTIWAIKVTGKFNASVMTGEQLHFLSTAGGMACGLGQWRNEKHGIFGAFHIGTPEEDVEWERFAVRKGPLPIPASYQSAEAAE